MATEIQIIGKPINPVFIYKIFTDSSVYIGRTKNPRRRMREHLSSLRKGIHQNRWMQSSYDENYSEFKAELIAVCDESICVKVEQFFIETIPESKTWNSSGRKNIPDFVELFAQLRS